jgi:hypothetical protein
VRPVVPCTLITCLAPCSLSLAPSLQVDVELLVSGAAAGDSTAEVVIHVDLWAAEGLMAILQVDSRGRITQLHEPTLRPAHLLFGVPQKELMAEPVSSLLCMPPGKKGPADLCGSASRKKSNLKSSKAKKNEPVSMVGPGRQLGLLLLHASWPWACTAREHNTKPNSTEVNRFPLLPHCCLQVGPLHKLQAAHRDGQPLTVSVQVVAQAGSGGSMTMFITLHNPASGVPESRPARNLGGAALAESAAPLATTRSAAHPPNAASPRPPPVRKSVRWVPGAHPMVSAARRRSMLAAGGAAVPSLLRGLHEERSATSHQGGVVDNKRSIQWLDNVVKSPGPNQPCHD